MTGTHGDAPGEAPRRGKTTIAPDVLLTIAKLSALGVPGVARMSPVPGGVNRLFRRGAGDGVRIEVKDNAVAVDLYLVVAHDTRVRDVSRAVQAEVARAIEEMVGMDVLSVDVHIEDVAFPEGHTP
jgi:uncharacterized alkaline shock family protein YloU